MQDSAGPDLDSLYQTASAQGGQFTIGQAAEAGFSRQLLNRHLGSKFERILRGIYRFRHYPHGEHEDLVSIWLWSEREAVFSHETALGLHQLSDSLPAKRSLTLPSSWASRRLRFPPGTVAHFQDLAQEETTWSGCVPVTTPLKTVLDCYQAHVEPILVEQALEEGLRRGLFSSRQLPEELRGGVR